MTGVEIALTKLARRRQVRRRGLQGLRRPPRRRRVGGQRAVDAGSSSRSTATASATAWSSPTAASRRPSSRSSATRPAGRTGTTVTFWPDGTVFETIEFSARTILERLQMMAFLNKGLEIRFQDERPEPRRRAGHVYKYAGGIIDFVKHVNTVEGGRCSRKVGYFEQAEDGPGGRGRVPVEHRLQRPTASTPSPTASTPSRAAPTRRASRRRSPRWSTSTPGPRTSSRRRTPNLAGRGHPRGHHRHHLGAPPRPAVRGPDQGQARQHRDQDARAEGHQREARRLARGEPHRGQQDRQEGASPPPRPAMAAKKARDVIRRKTLLDGAGMPDKLKDCSARKNRERARAVHRRGRLGRRLGRQGPRPAHARRSCRSAARSSTSSGPASTRCSRTSRSRR